MTESRAKHLCALEKVYNSAKTVEGHILRIFCQTPAKRQTYRKTNGHVRCVRLFFFRLNFGPSVFLLGAV